MEELKEITQEQEEQVEMIKELHSKEMLHLKTSSNTALGQSYYLSRWTCDDSLHDLHMSWFW